MLFLFTISGWNLSLSLSVSQWECVSANMAQHQPILTLSYPTTIARTPGCHNHTHVLKPALAVLRCSKYIARNKCMFSEYVLKCSKSVSATYTNYAEWVRPINLRRNVWSIKKGRLFVGSTFQKKKKLSSTSCCQGPTIHSKAEVGTVQQISTPDDTIASFEPRWQCSRSPDVLMLFLFLQYCNFQKQEPSNIVFKPF